MLDEKAECLIRWWTSKIHSCVKSLYASYPDIFNSTDFSMSGWGACTDHKITGGHWAEHEKDHINIFELKSVLFGNKALLQVVRQKHVQIKFDNTTVIATINNYGSVNKRLLNVVDLTINCPFLTLSSNTLRH